MLNDTQFMEAYRKLAERVMKASGDAADHRALALWRCQRKPFAAELAFGAALPRRRTGPHAAHPTR